MYLFCYTAWPQQSIQPLNQYGLWVKCISKEIPIRSSRQILRGTKTAFQRPTILSRHFCKQEKYLRAYQSKCLKYVNHLIPQILIEDITPSGFLTSPFPKMMSCKIIFMFDAHSSQPYCYYKQVKNLKCSHLSQRSTSPGRPCFDL